VIEVEADQAVAVQHEADAIEAAVVEGSLNIRPGRPRARSVELARRPLRG
jgi:hypothetical protein